MKLDLLALTSPPLTYVPRDIPSHPPFLSTKPTGRYLGKKKKKQSGNVAEYKMANLATPSALVSQLFIDSGRCASNLGENQSIKIILPN